MKSLSYQFGVGGVIVVAVASVSAGQTSEENVVVLVNQNSADSIAIGDAYQALRPGVTLLNIDVPNTETIDIATYQTSLLPQVQAYLGQGDNVANTHVIVTTKGVPYRISGASGTEFDIQSSTFSSVESELTLAAIDLARQNAGAATLSNSPSALFNPYRATTTIDLNSDPDVFDRASTYTPIQRFGKYRQINASNELGSLILTSRLDGFTVDDVVASLNRAQNVTVPRNAQFILDRDTNFDPPIDNLIEKRDGADVLIRGLREELEQRGVQPVVDVTSATITTANGPVISYTGLGSNGAFDDAPVDGFSYVTEELDFELADGAVFISYESFNATSFELQSDGSPANRGGQAQVAEWIAIGGTAAGGHAWEPFDLSVSNEEVLIPALLDGLTFAEAAWLSNELISWQNVPVGDPLLTWNFEELRRGTTVPEPGIAAIALGGLLLRRRR
ncbi:MAG: hypothetical protein AAGD32_06535 [Planctomycetota bacterium]